MHLSSFIHCSSIVHILSSSGLQNSSLTSIRVPQGTAHRCVVFETLTLFYTHEFHVYLTIHALVGVTTRDESNIDVTPLPREDVTHVLPSPPLPTLPLRLLFTHSSTLYLLFQLRCDELHCLCEKSGAEDDKGDGDDDDDLDGRSYGRVAKLASTSAQRYHHANNTHAKR